MKISLSIHDAIVARARKLQHKNEERSLSATVARLLAEALERAEEEVER